MPLVQPAELWQETGRWDKMGPELMRVKDRHGRDYAIQPTSEEVITDVVRTEIKSYRQLPLNFYHIQTKFRDERRPRFGLMRGREFTMKDAYSFDRDLAGMQASYKIMFDAYSAHLHPLRPEVPRGGGRQRRHRRHRLARIPRHRQHRRGRAGVLPDLRLRRQHGSGRSDAAGRQPPAAAAGADQDATPGTTKCEQVAALLKLPLAQTVKTIALTVEKEVDGKQVKENWMLLLRGDHELNEVKVAKVPGLAAHRFATEAEILECYGTMPGYLGPIGTASSRSTSWPTARSPTWPTSSAAPTKQASTTPAPTGAATSPSQLVADLRNVVEGDASPDGKGVLAIERGIEVGHVFQLGTAYSESMKATFLDENGKPAPLQMGCYGIGVTRILGAAIEQNFDDKGIIWPTSIAPFEVVLCPMGMDRSEMVKDEVDSSCTRRCRRPASTSSSTTAACVRAPCSPTGN